MAAPPPQAPFEVEITVSSARDLKNINWKNGPLSPYAVVWVDPNYKCSTKVDKEGDSCPRWDERLVIPVFGSVQDSTLYIDIVHANAKEDNLKNPLIGSARVPLREIVDDVGFDDKVHRSLQLKRPSGRPHGRLEVKLMVRENRYRGPDPYYAPPYGVPPPGSQSRGFDPYGAPPPAGYPAYGGGYAPPPFGYPYSTAPPPSGYPYSTVAPPPSGYAPPAPYGSAPPSTEYGYNAEQSQYGAYDSQGNKDGSSTQKKGSKYGVGTGIAVGAVAGVLGGLALAEGAECVEDKFDETVDERVDEQLANDGDFGGYDDDY